MLFLIFKGVKVTRKETIGILMSLIGCIGLVADPKAERTAEGNLNPIVAMFIDLSSAAFGAGFLILSAKNAKLLPIFLLIFVMQIQLFLINGVIAAFFEPNI